MLKKRFDKQKTEFAQKVKFIEKKKCRFCKEKIENIDYKDVPQLQKLTNIQGRLFSRKRSGNCARHQRIVKKAIKRARYMAFLP